MKSYHLYKIVIIGWAILAINCVTIDEKPKSSDLAGTYHLVKPGDTLLKLAHKYQVPIDEIMEVNGIDNEHSLRVGQALFMPDPDPIGKKIASFEKNNKKPISPIKQNNTFHHARIFDFPIPGGAIIYRFSKAKDKPYDGIGIKAPRGTKVICPYDGQVLFVGDDGTKFGLLVILEHKEPYITIYAHLDRAHVSIGQKIKKGQILGNVGTSGGVSIPHLHFQIRVNRRPMDPALFIKRF